MTEPQVNPEWRRGSRLLSGIRLGPHLGTGRAFQTTCGLEYNLPLGSRAHVEIFGRGHMQASPTRLAAISRSEFVAEVLSDQRGFFFESYRKSDFASLGIGDEFVQDNQSGSSGGVLRGLHYQIKHAQESWCGL